MAVSFSDLHTAEGLKALEAHLAGKTYISGDAISKDDIKVFAAVPTKPGAEFPNAARWYDTVSAAVASRFPGKAAGVNLAGAGASSAPAAAAPAAEAAKDAMDDDDLDLFGDETEEDKKAAEERAASKASTKKKESGKSSVLMDVKPWDDETDMKKSEEAVRSVHLEGPTWGACMADATESEHLAEEEEQEEGMAEGEEGLGSEGEEEGCKKRKHPLKKCLDGFSKRGVCYLSRVPPHMNPSHVRQMFSKYGEVQRIYLVPEGQGHRKHANVRAKAYSEGWIEFAKKSVAKRVANLLNGEQIGGKKRSSFYYDIWNIKYLRKFKWDDLVGEIAEKTHIREQKLTLEITAAKKQRDHYLSNAEKSRTQKIIRERIRKKQKTEGKESNDVVQTKFDHPIPQQKKRIERGPRTNSELSKDILAGVFSGSS